MPILNRLKSNIARLNCFRGRQNRSQGTSSLTPIRRNNLTRNPSASSASSASKIGNDDNEGIAMIDKASYEKHSKIFNKVFDTIILYKGDPEKILYNSNPESVSSASTPKAPIRARDDESSVGCMSVMNGYSTSDDGISSLSGVSGLLSAPAAKTKIEDTDSVKSKFILSDSDSDDSISSLSGVFSAEPKQRQPKSVLSAFLTSATPTESKQRKHKYYKFEC